MALTVCHECRKPISTDAKSCPSCGAFADAKKQRNVARSTALTTIVSAVVVGAAAIWFFSDGFPSLVSDEQAAIEQSVIVDAMRQLNTAMEGGADSVQICAYAQLVTAAMIQAKDSVKLSQFKPTERRLCARAGM